MNNSAPDKSARLLEAGLVGRPHGVRGELSAVWRALRSPAKGDLLVIRRAGQDSGLRVVSVRRHNGRLLLTLEGVSDRGAAAALNGAKIFMDRRNLPDLEENEAYLQDLIGCQVRLEDGSVVGELDHVEFPAGREVWAIAGAKGQEILFPARPEFIAAIDIDAKAVVIDPPPGLLDIYDA